MSFVAIEVPPLPLTWSLTFDDLVTAVAEDERLQGSGARVVARRDPQTIVISGVDDEALIGDIALLRSSIASSVPHARWISDDDVANLAETLARELRERIDDLDRYTVVPIARGGLFVAGHLAYRTPLRRQQFVTPASTEDAHGPALLVDDISLSGNRVGTMLETLGGRPTVVATLLAAEPVKAELMAREPTLIDMIAAETLPDRTSDLVNGDLEAYRTRWQSDEVYWIGRTDHVVFPWSEPESEATNPVTGRASVGWKLAPSAKCLGNRVDHPPVPVIWDVASTVAASIEPGWIIGRHGEATLLTRDAGEGEAIELDDVASDMFWTYAESSDRAEAVRCLVQRWDAESDVIATDFDELLDRLSDIGLLKRAWN